jgi:hypothetical protein
MGGSKRRPQTLQEGWRSTPKGACVETSDTVLLNPWELGGETAWLFFGLWHYRKRLTHFCLELSVRDRETDGQRKIERVDTCHEELHRHRFRRSNPAEDNVGEVNPLYSLGPNMHNELEASYDEHYVRLNSQWPQILEKWRAS